MKKINFLAVVITLTSNTYVMLRHNTIPQNTAVSDKSLETAYFESTRWKASDKKSVTCNSVFNKYSNA